MSAATRVPQGNYLRRFERSYRATLMYKSSHTALVVWRVLWDYYHKKKLRASSIQVTQQLRKQVKSCLPYAIDAQLKFSPGMLLRGGNNMTPSTQAKIGGR